MVDLAILQVVRDLVAIFGVIAGLTYYVITVRNAQKTRQTQILMQLYQSMYNPENSKRLWELMAMTWEDYDDYMEKYSPQTNQEHAAMRIAYWYLYDGLGMLVRDKVVDVKTVYRTLGRRILMVWYKFETVFKKLRLDEERELGSDYLEDFEHLANEMIKIRKQRGQPLPIQYLHPTSTLRSEAT